MAKTTQGNATKKQAASFKRHRTSYGATLSAGYGMTTPEERKRNLEYFHRPAYGDYKLSHPREEKTMSAKKELEYASTVVRDVLESNPETRDSDDKLYYQVCKLICPDISVIPFGKVLMNRKHYGLPAFESVRRTRQKLQHDYPELRACNQIDVERKIREEEFREYARQ